VSDLWICKHASKCTGVSVDHVRYRHRKSNANWYRIGCHSEYYQDDYGQTIAVRWKGAK
jgi:hypothetical protein